MARCDLGKTMIDELRLCYIAESKLLDDLKGMEFGQLREYDAFTILRVVCSHFQYGFEVFYCPEVNARRKVAMLKFARYGEQDIMHYLYYRIENPILYDTSLLDAVLRIPEMLGCSFNNFTSMDLCRDYKVNVTKMIFRMLRDQSMTTIINGKAVSRKDDIQEGTVTYPLNLTRMKNPTLNIKQRKAVKDKTQGLTMCGYNKLNEIDKSSHKDYICDFYENPRTLHRLEVHQNSAEIKDFCKKEGIVPDWTLVFNQEFLDKMYIYHLSSLLRFTKGRKPLNWEDLLQ